MHYFDVINTEHHATVYHFKLMKDRFQLSSVYRVVVLLGLEISIKHLEEWFPKLNFSVYFKIIVSYQLSRDDTTCKIQTILLPR